MKIYLMKNPENKTKFESGDVLGYEGSQSRFMAVGEDDMYLHTFTLNTGKYWGVLKKDENLSCLIRFKD